MNKRIKIFKNIYDNSLHDLPLHASTAQYLGRIYMMGLGVDKDYTKSLYYLKRAHKLFTRPYKLSTRDAMTLSKIAGAIGKIYITLQDYPAALPYLQESYNLGKTL